MQCSTLLIGFKNKNINSLIYSAIFNVFGVKLVREDAIGECRKLFITDSSASYEVTWDRPSSAASLIAPRIV